MLCFLVTNPWARAVGIDHTEVARGITHSTSLDPSLQYAPKRVAVASGYSGPNHLLDGELAGPFNGVVVYGIFKAHS